MTKGVVGMVMFAGTSREAWETLAGVFTATSFARSSGLCQQMAELKKRDMKVNIYFHNMKALADELTSIGQPLRDDELISYILAGLPKEFEIYTLSSKLRSIATTLVAPTNSTTRRLTMPPRRVHCTELLLMLLPMVNLVVDLPTTLMLACRRQVTSLRRRLLLLVQNPTRVGTPLSLPTLRYTASHRVQVLQTL
jgi:hypothetical protein